MYNRFRELCNKYNLSKMDYIASMPDHRHKHQVCYVNMSKPFFEHVQPSLKSCEPPVDSSWVAVFYSS